MSQWAAVDIPRRVLVRLQTSPNEPVKHIPVPEHRTEPVTCDESVYVGVLTVNCKRKVFRTFGNTPLSGNREFIPMEDVPETVLRVINKGLDHLETIYFPKR
jgi:hypothetical protein